MNDLKPGTKIWLDDRQKWGTVKTTYSATIHGKKKIIVDLSDGSDVKFTQGYRVPIKEHTMIEQIKNHDYEAFKTIFEQNLQQKINDAIEDQKMRMAAEIFESDDAQAYIQKVRTRVLKKFGAKSVSDLSAEQKKQYDREMEKVVQNEDAQLDEAVVTKEWSGIESNLEKAAKNVDRWVSKIKSVFPDASNGFRYKPRRYDSNPLGYGLVVNFKKRIVTSNGMRDEWSLEDAAGMVKLNQMEKNLMIGNDAEAGIVVFLDSEGESYITLEYKNALSNRAVGMIFSDEAAGFFQEDFKSDSEMMKQLQKLKQTLSSGRA